MKIRFFFGPPLVFLVLLIPPASSADAQLYRPLIPFKSVSKKEHRTRLSNLAKEYTLYRELPPTVIQGNQEQFEFLLDQLDLTTLIVRNLSLGKQKLRRNSPIEWTGDDGEGLSGRMTLVHREKTKRIYLARGRLKGLFFFPIHGRAVIVANRAARDQQTHSLHLTLYVKLDNRFLDVITHVFSPLLSGAVTGRISKFLAATSIASQAIHEDPERIYQIIRNAEELEEERKSQFSSLFLSRAAAGPLGGESNVQPVSAPSGPAPRETLRK